LQRAGKNGIADTLEQVELLCYGIVFLHKRCIPKTRVLLQSIA
jgi:hypothetical protein